MNSEKLLAAMSGIDSRYITEAQDALCYRTGDKKRASHKTIWRTLFIAAVISALFTAAAAASATSTTHRHTPPFTASPADGSHVPPAQTAVIFYMFI